MSETTSILLVDGSPVREPFLRELLNTSGKVTGFQTPEKALDAVLKGLSVDVAVLHYQRKTEPLIRAIRHHRPKVKIVAFGASRALPEGVDEYFRDPVLGADVLVAIEQMSRRRAARSKSRN